MRSDLKTPGRGRADARQAGVIEIERHGLSGGNLPFVVARNRPAVEIDDERRNEKLALSSARRLGIRRVAHCDAKNLIRNDARQVVPILSGRDDLESTKAALLAAGRIVEPNLVGSVATNGDRPARRGGGDLQ